MANKETTKKDVNHTSTIEVYDDGKSSFTTNFKQNSLNWYINEKHTTEDSIVKIEQKGGSDITTNIKSTNKGFVSFKISNSNSKEGTYRMHIDIKPWFWYFPQNLGSSYNYDSTSCTEHPCFEYIFKKTSHPSGVVSGDFNGSDYNVSSRGHYEKTGVKVFR